MREMKFRGKRYGDNSWVYGNLYQGTKEGEQYSIILNDAGYHIASQDDRNFAIAFFENEVNVVFSNTIGQYTGLKDKNGKEIYEGDILRSNEYPFNCDGVDNYFAEIVWADNVCGFYRITLKNPNSTVRGISHGICEQLDEEEIKSFEVIGNIYDNKELVIKK